jgi:hypothetical protein
MTRIRYVSISDLHLGASNSILTPEALGGAPGCDRRPLELLAACLRDVARLGVDQKPTLVVNGDLLELALTTIGRATQVCDDFLAQLTLDGSWPFDARLVFLAGNHDHHLWELAREAWYMDEVSRTPVQQPMPEAVHASSLAGSIGGTVLDDPYLGHVLKRHAATAHCSVTASYPNYALHDASSDRAVVFHHGHFIEAIYSMISGLRTVMFAGMQRPQDVEELEAENFAWIDFFWSTLGRSGAAGEDIFLIYDKLHDSAAVKVLMNGFAAGLLEKRHGREWMKRVEKDVLEGFLDVTIGRLAEFELKQSGTPLSAAAVSGLHSYVEGPLHKQISRELGAIPAGLTLIMGHTHKPFETLVDFAGYPKPVPVYNSGGFVVDTPAPEHCHGGSIVVVDDELNAASIQIYFEPFQGSTPAVEVVGAGGDNPLVDYLKCELKTDAAPWSDFLSAGGRAAGLCRTRIRQRIEATSA